MAPSCCTCHPIGSWRRRYASSVNGTRRHLMAERSAGRVRFFLGICAKCYRLVTFTMAFFYLGTGLSLQLFPLMGWSGRAPARQQAKLVRGAKDKEHAMSDTRYRDRRDRHDIGKNSFQVVGHDAG